MRELFDWVYRILRSKMLGAVVIIAMAVLALLGTLIAQAPASADEQAYAAFLESVRPRYGGWTPILDALGLYQLWSSPIFLGVTVLLALSIIACTVHRIPQLWRRATEPRVHVTEKFFDRAQYRAELVLPMSVDDAAAHAGSVLKKQHYRRLPDEKLDGSVGWYADRFRWGPFGTAIAHGAMVIILMAFGVSAFTGFEEYLDIAIGDSAEVGHGTGLTVTAESFKDEYDELGRPTDYVSYLVVERDGQVVAEQDTRVNEPIKAEGTTIHQASFGIAAAITVAIVDGEQLFQGPVPLKWQSNDGLYAIGKIEPPGTGLEVLVVTPASGATEAAIAAGSAVFEVYNVESGERLDVVGAEQGEVVESGNLVLTFERELRYTGLIARQDPGAMWMWVGSTLLVLGMYMTFTLRHRRLWVRISPVSDGARLRIASAEKLDTTFERHFRTLIAQIDETAPETFQGNTPSHGKELIDA
ncbi:MAG: cytochrome c biogenesis protein ResB [Tessaracoccus sp.]